MHTRWNLWVAMLALVVSGGVAGCAAKARPAPPDASQTPGLAVKLELEPKAIDLLKATSTRLAAARTMRFTAVVSYESPSRLGPPLLYTTKSDVALQRPNKLRVITAADGPPAEFYYDGKTIMAFAPKENLVAVADAPPTIDGALKAAYDLGEMYYPFTDLIVADPYGDIAAGLTLAFYVGQSQVVGGTTTDIIAYASDTVFVQMWIGTKDKLPRMMRAVYRHDPSRLRHQMELSDWQLDGAVPAAAFTSAKAAKAKHVKFTPPDPMPPVDAKGASK